MTILLRIACSFLSLKLSALLIASTPPQPYCPIRSLPSEAVTSRLNELLLEVLGIQIHRDSSHKTTGLLATGLVRVTTSWEFIGRASLFIVGVYLSCKFICRASLFIV